MTIIAGGASDRESDKGQALKDVDYIRAFAQNRGFVCTREAAADFLAEHSDAIEARLEEIRLAGEKYDKWLTTLLATWERSPGAER